MAPERDVEGDFARYLAKFGETRESIARGLRPYRTIIVLVD
jgi:hypothetical protein